MAPTAVCGSRRAPAHAPVRIPVDGREKDGPPCSVSERVCFIESSRANMEGARLTLTFELDDRAFELTGPDVFSNVPGNQQRSNLPLGMGVRFDDVLPPALDSLKRFIQSRAEAPEIYMLFRLSRISSRRAA